MTINENPKNYTLARCADCDRIDDLTVNRISDRIICIACLNILFRQAELLLKNNQSNQKQGNNNERSSYN